MSHTWTFQVAPGASYRLYVNAYRTPDNDIDHYLLAYSENDSDYINMLTVSKTEDDDIYQTYVFPEDVAGTLYIRVEDTDRNKGNLNPGTISVDHLYIQVTALAPEPTPLPTPLPATTPRSSGLFIY